MLHMSTRTHRNTTCQIKLPFRLLMEVILRNVNAQPTWERRAEKKHDQTRQHSMSIPQM